MERIPNPILAQIMFFLDPETVLNSFMLINKTCSRLVHNQIYSSEYLREYFKTSTHFSTSLPILRSLAKQSELSLLDFFGFGTTGGMQNCDEIYWVDNMYYGHSFNAYPSHTGKFNINTAGVLSSTQIKGRLLNQCRKTLYRDSCLLYTSPSPRDS